MSNLPPFTLIYESAVESREKEAEKGTEAVPVGSTKSIAPASGRKRPSRKTGAAPAGRRKSKIESELITKLDSIDVNPELRRTLMYTCETQHSFEDDAEKAIRDVIPIVDDLARQANVTTIALWDLDARVGNLPALIKVLNEAQSVMTFFELQGAPLSAALVSRPELMIEWVRSRTDKRLSKADREEIAENLNANDFYAGAGIIQKSTGVDYLVGISPYMIAGETDDEVFWNRFSNVSGRLLLVSTYGLREYSERAGRPSEVGLAMIIIAAIAVAMNRRLDYHDTDDTGCLVDHNVDRDNIVRCISELKIDDECLKKFDKKNREAFLALLEALKDHTDTPQAAEPEAVDYDFWLGELDKLSEE